MHRQVALRPLALAIGLFVVACGPGAPAQPPPPTSVAATPEPSTPAAPAELPGEPIELYPYAGAGLSVVGVAADDTLSLRAGPGTGFPVLSELAPLADKIQATGQNRSLPDLSWWSEVLVDGRTGWVNSRYVAQAGATDDVTSTLPGPIRGASMADLATATIRVRGLESDNGGNTVVVDGPRAGDLDELVVDVLGLADDAQRGERLHIFAVKDQGGYVVRTVEATALCARGVTADGDCV